MMNNASFITFRIKNEYMKNLKYLLMVLLFWGVTACSDDKDSLGEPSLAVSTEKVEFTSIVSSKRIKVIANNVDWEVESTEAWLTYERNSYDLSELRVNTSRNPDLHDRTGKLIITGKDVSPVEVLVVQSAKYVKPTLSVENDMLSIVYIGGVFEIEVNSPKVDWQIKSTPDWFEASKDEERNMLILKFKENTLAEDLTGQLVLSGTTEEPVEIEDLVITVTQLQDLRNKVNIWERNSLYYANLKGNVEFVDVMGGQIYDAKFNELGNLVSYAINEKKSPVTVEYNDKNQVVHVKMEKIEVFLEYENGDKFVHIDDFVEEMGIDGAWVYQPKFVRGLSKIILDFKSGLLYEFDFKVKNSESLVVNINGNGPWMSYTYEGDYPILYEIDGEGTDSEKGKHEYYLTHVFDINPVTGRYIKMEKHLEKIYEDGDSDFTSETKLYNDDNQNTVNKNYKDHLFTYDAQGNVTLEKFTNTYEDDLKIDIEYRSNYTMDPFNNWISKKTRFVIVEYDSDIDVPVIVNRNITYRK